MFLLFILSTTFAVINCIYLIHTMISLGKQDRVDEIPAVDVICSPIRILYIVGLYAITPPYGIFGVLTGIFYISEMILSSVLYYLEEDELPSLYDLTSIVSISTFIIVSLLT